VDHSVSRYFLFIQRIYRSSNHLNKVRLLPCVMIILNHNAYKLFRHKHMQLTLRNLRISINSFSDLCLIRSVRRIRLDQRYDNDQDASQGMFSCFSTSSYLCPKHYWWISFSRYILSLHDFIAVQTTHMKHPVFTLFH